MTHPSGGLGTVGQWSILNDDLSLQDTLFETQGLPSPNIEALFSGGGIDNIGGKKAVLSIQKQTITFTVLSIPLS